MALLIEEGIDALKARPSIWAAVIEDKKVGIMCHLGGPAEDETMDEEVASKIVSFFESELANPDATWFINNKSLATWGQQSFVLNWLPRVVKFLA